MDFSELTTIGITLCTIVGVVCVVLSIFVAFKDRRFLKDATDRKIIRDAEAQLFVVKARVAENERNAVQAHHKEDVDRQAAKVALGLNPAIEHDRDAIMTAWRIVMKANHPDMKGKDTSRITIDKAKMAREVLLRH